MSSDAESKAIEAYVAGYLTGTLSKYSAISGLTPVLNNGMATGELEFTLSGWRLRVQVRAFGKDD